MNHSTTTVNVLIVDDEQKMTSFIASYLANEGYGVREVHSGAEALRLLETDGSIDLVLLDWMMPGMNGLDVCRRLRTFSDVPVLFLTAKSEEIDKLLGLEIGADDFITKPFSMRELEARIRVVLRRTVKRSAPPDVPEEPMWKRGRLSIDLPGHTVYLDGRPVALTPTEFKILVTLAKSPGRVFSRLDLLEIALGEEYSGYERTIDTHIRNLRKKLERDFSSPELIVTVHGIGYKLGDPQ
ncbi:response regulator transcription factor [Paenibacillus sp.]|uniref:response regulator transcription factor n=1 Tax=Paenibacillus sp. TaxID=58172 RepID=UPI002D457F16|nr:response regulator transcription factor [Paenibacillus sp.]HZG56150.1 response regulator transcription factor [Paenibacillus sp.]